MMKQLTGQLGGRKAVVFGAIFIFSAAVTFLKFPVADNIIDLLKWAGGSYMASNGVVAIAKAIGGPRQ